MIRKLKIARECLKHQSEFACTEYVVARRDGDLNSFVDCYVLTESELEYFAYVVANYVQNYPCGLDQQMFQEAFVEGLNSND